MLPQISKSKRPHYNYKFTIVITNQFLYNKEIKTFSVEVSDLKDFLFCHVITLKNKKTGGTKEFTWYKTDMDGSHEDIYGWRYKSEDGLELLIVND